MDDTLHEYNEKRDFTKTLEPQGSTAERGESLSFVVQHHLARKDHFDFRLQWRGTLISFAVPKGPSYNPRDKRLAIKVEDHPIEYKNFEGTIAKGEYGGGTVMIWDEGTWEPLSDVDEGLEHGSLKFNLFGVRLRGKWALVRMKTDEKSDNWLLLKEKDEFIKAESGIDAFNTSTRTGRTMEEIEKGENEKTIKNPFDHTDVQLAKLVTAVPKDDTWLYELKYDGYRIVAFIEGSTVRLMTRNNNDYTNRFRAVAATLLALSKGRAMVLDGEMAVTDESGRTDFQELQNYMKNRENRTLTYFIFDLLALCGEDLRPQPLIKRKELLETLLKDAPQNLHYSRHVEGQGEESFKTACTLGMEGIVGKKPDSIYSGTRNGDWIKIKCGKRQEFVIGGYALSDKKTSGVSSLLLGAYTGGDLLYIGRAGTGFSESMEKDLEAQFKTLITPDPPFKNTPNPKKGEKVTWLMPKLIAEIKYADMTEEKLLRQASFKGLRTDKAAADIKLETEEDTDEPQLEETENTVETVDSFITISGIKISSPDKVMYPGGITKLDIVRYYEKVAKRMMPYVKHRILSVICCPGGISKTCFFKKHLNTESKGTGKISLQNSDGEPEEYFYIEDETGIIWGTQLNTVEFHVWGSRTEEPEKPDMMVFDLDPDEGMDISKIRQGVLDMKEVLSQLSLVSFLKTSGGKGYHVVVPLKPAGDWDKIHDFAKQVAEVMEKKWPERYTSNVKKTRRKDKIFIDWMRNGRGATSVAPYSIRAREGASVSMPISWDELNNVLPNGIDMKEALLRIEREDPWKGMLDTEQFIKNFGI